MKIKNDFVRIEITTNGKTKTIEKRNFLTDLYIKRYKEYVMQKMLGISKPIAEMNKIFITLTPQVVTEASTSITGTVGVIDSQFVFDTQSDSDIEYNENFLTITHRYTTTLDSAYAPLFGTPFYGIGFGDVAYFGTNDYLYAWLQLIDFNIIVEEGTTLNIVRQDTYFNSGLEEDIIPYHLSQYGIDGKYGYLDTISLGSDIPEVSMEDVVIDNTIADEISFSGDLYLSSDDIPFYPSEDLYPQDTTVVSGTTITLTDAVDDYGNITAFECASTQTQTTTGANKAETITSAVYTGVYPASTTFGTNTVNFDQTAGGGAGVTSRKFSVPINTVLTISADIKSTVASAGTAIQIFKADGTTLLSNETKTLTTSYARYSNATFNTGTETQLIIKFARTTATGITSVTNIMLAIGTTTYEAYIPNSPSPDYPSTIYSSGDGGLINTWVHKKNMFIASQGTTTIRGVTATITADNINLNGTVEASSFPWVKITNGLASRNGTPSSANEPTWFQGNIRLIVGNTYTFSTNSPIATALELFNQDGTRTNVFVIGNTTKTLTITKEVANIGLYLGGAGTTFSNVDIKIQLELGTVATAYEAYTGADYPITLPVGYVGGSLPNGVKDSDTVKNVDDITYNGTENWGSVGNSGNYISFFLALPTAKASTTNDIKNNLYCDKFKNISINEITAYTQEGIGLDTGSIIAVVILKTRLVGYSEAWTNAQKNTAFKTFLTTNNIIVYYPLATPLAITTTLPQIQTYNGYTVVETTNAVKPTLTLEYMNNALFPVGGQFISAFQKYKIYNGAVDSGTFYFIKSNLKDLDASFNNEQVSLKITYERGV